MKQMFRVLHLVVAFSLMLTVSGCGFHLRGNITLPKGVEPIYISGIDNHAQLGVELRSLLNTNNIQLASSIEEANYKLVILTHKTDRRTTALGEGARVAEYQLIEEIIFEMRNAQGKRVLGPNRITERKIIPNDPNKVVSTTEEEKLLRREMLQNLAVKVTRQLRVFNYKDSE